MKRTVCLLLAVITVLLFSACSLEIEDTNGADDFSLVTLTDEDILKNAESRSMVSSVTSTVNDKTTISIKKFSGVYSIRKIHADGEDYTFDFDVKVESGNLRVVIVDKDNKTILRDVAINQAERFKLENLSGEYIIKLAGESAKLSAVISYTVE